jgi:hypothetical protein
MVVPELNCCALDSFRLFTVSSPQIKEDPFKCSATAPIQQDYIRPAGWCLVVSDVRRWRRRLVRGGRSYRHTNRLCSDSNYREVNGIGERSSSK